MGGKVAEIAMELIHQCADALFPRLIRRGCCNTSKTKVAPMPPLAKDLILKISLASKFPIRTMSCCLVGAGQYDRRSDVFHQLVSPLQVKGTVFLQDDLNGAI